MDLNPVSNFYTRFKLYVLGVVIVSVVAGSAFFGYHIESLENAKAMEKQRIVWQAQVDKEREDGIAKTEKERNRLDGIAAVFEKKLENLRPIYQTINRTVEKEIQTNTIYTDMACALPKSGIDMLNQNVLQLNATRKVSQ